MAGEEVPVRVDDEMEEGMGGRIKAGSESVPGVSAAPVSVGVISS